MTLLAQYTYVSTDTFQVISRLARCVQSSFNIEVMNVSKQSDAVDCGLYAIASAIITGLSI